MFDRYQLHPDDPFGDERFQRQLEQQQLRRRRRRRIIIAGSLVLACVLAAGVVALATHGDRRARDDSDAASDAAGRISTLQVPTRTTPDESLPTTPPPDSTAGQQASPPPATKAVTSDIARARAALAGIGVVQHPIPYSASRRGEMAAYAMRHYGISTSTLDPSIIVLHFTAGNGNPWSTFAANTPAAGPAGSKPELPGVCAHFVVMKDGTIEQFVPLDVMCRHAIGLNDKAIGIEMEEPAAASNILARPVQLQAAVRLVEALQDAYGIADSRVVGHAMANDDPEFRDLRGWRNDHSDWSEGQVERFRAQLGSS